MPVAVPPPVVAAPPVLVVVVVVDVIRVVELLAAAPPVPVVAVVLAPSGELAPPPVKLELESLPAPQPSATQAKPTRKEVRRMARM